jgi:hypothetical protein
MSGVEDAGLAAVVLSRTWRADGGVLAAAGQADGGVRLWDFADAAPRQRILSLVERDGYGIDALARSPEGHLVMGNLHGTIAILPVPCSTRRDPSPRPFAVNEVREQRSR